MFLSFLSTVFVILIATYINKKANFGSTVEFVASMVMAMGGVFLLFYSVAIYFYVAAGYQADLINKEFGTNYTQSQVFYASDVIEEVRHIKRLRLEADGDLLECIKSEY